MPVTKLISVHDVKLDPENPRIARMIEMYGPNVTAVQISLALGVGDVPEGETYTTFRSLRESIRANGGIIQPIIVNRQSDGDLVAIEGNTRLQIYRDFLEQGVEGDWGTILAIVHEGLERKSIDAIRLQAHLVGPRPWDPYSKARYLTSLRNDKHMTMEQIIEFCGGRKRQVLDYIDAYQDMEKYYRPRLGSNRIFDVTRFSAFVELQKPNIVHGLTEAAYTKEDFAQWVIDGLFAPIATVRQLPRILEHPAAREVFLADGAQEAIKSLETEPADASLENASLTQLALELTRRVTKLQFSDIQRLKAEPHNENGEALFEAKAQLVDLLALVSEEEDA